MSTQEIFQEIEHRLNAGETVVQATIIQTKGSTPRKVGSRMLVRADGSLFGTIGGGCGEAGVIQKARLSLLDGKIREDTADLTEDISTESEAVCGGTMRVFIQPWRPTPENKEMAGRLKALADGNHEVVIHQVVGPAGENPALGSVVVQESEADSPAGPALPPLESGRHRQLKRVGDREIYSERWLPVPSLIIVGAGHIAEPLETFGRNAGFRTVVVDDRRLFANRHRFPKAHQVVCGPILEVVRQIGLTPHSYLVLVTRGHTLDMDALRVVIERGEPLAYLGMIGSSRRIRAVFQLMEEEGFSRDLFRHVRAPIGLDLGAETPAEIAISIVAEMISVRHGGGDDTRPLVSKNAIHLALRPLPAKAPKAAGKG